MDEFLFECPDCKQTIAVNQEMRAAILEKNCPVCTARVEEIDFEPTG